MAYRHRLPSEVLTTAECAVSNNGYTLGDDHAREILTIHEHAGKNFPSPGGNLQMTVYVYQFFK